MRLIFQGLSSIQVEDNRQRERDRLSGELHCIARLADAAGAVTVLISNDDGREDRGREKERQSICSQPDVFAIRISRCGKSCKGVGMDRAAWVEHGAPIRREMQASFASFQRRRRGRQSAGEREKTV